MTSRNNLTLQFYENTAGSYVEKTRAIDMTDSHERFLRFVPKGGHILDAGCGSGRDAQAFRGRGYEISAFDGSERMARLAADFLGTPVRTLRFQDLDYNAEFDGIWACASLLHLEPVELLDVFGRLFRALKPGGLLYASFTHGAQTRFQEGRLFSDMSRDGFAKLCETSGGAYLEHWFAPISGRDRSWVSFLARAVPRRAIRACGAGKLPAHPACSPEEKDMDFDAFVDTAADYLEAAGIAYSPDLDEWLGTLWKQDVKPHLVVAEHRKRQSSKPEQSKD